MNEHHTVSVTCDDGETHEVCTGLSRKAAGEMAMARSTRSGCVHTVTRRGVLVARIHPGRLSDAQQRALAEIGRFGENGARVGNATIPTNTAVALQRRGLVRLAVEYVLRGRTYYRAFRT